MNAAPRRRAMERFMRAGRESSRLSVMFRFAIAAKLDLTVTDMECLDFLMEAGQATAGRLADQTKLTTGAVTGMLRRLERAGYITTERDPADRRRVIVTPVPEKVDRGRQLYARYGEQVEQVVADCTTEELDFLADHYDRMSEAYLAQLNVLRDSDIP
ncbi:MarR family winged helix-turn-helix transcriptional regulator [Saccharomonospora marina]|nr:MarR family transcriptional regulator [Saccharomonospora marina]